MSSDITIEHHGRNIAFLTFDRGMAVLTAHRVGSGFTLTLPAVVHTVSVLSDQPRLLISNLRGEVLVALPNNSKLAQDIGPRHRLGSNMLYT